MRRPDHYNHIAFTECSERTCACAECLNPRCLYMYQESFWIKQVMFSNIFNVYLWERLWWYQRQRENFTLWYVLPTTTQISLRSLISLRCPHEDTLHPWLSKMHQRWFRSDCANAQADLNLRWAHMSKCTFSNVAVHLRWNEGMLWLGKWNY